MRISQFDDLLRRHYIRPTDGGHLVSLEADVWRRIVARQSQQASNRFERVLAMVFPPEYRFASVAAALTVGLYAGMMLNQPQYRLGTVEALNFDVFSSHFSQLVTQSMSERL